MKLTAKLLTLAAVVGVVAALAGFAGSAKAALYPYPIKIGPIATQADLVVSSDGATVKVSNLGSVSVGGFYVAVSASSGNTCAGNGSETRYISGLGGYSSYSFTLATTSDAPRSVYVDSTNLVAESNETNNGAVIPAVFTAC